MLCGIYVRDHAFVDNSLSKSASKQIPQLSHGACQ